MVRLLLCFLNSSSQTIHNNIQRGWNVIFHGCFFNFLQESSGEKKEFLFKVLVIGDLGVGKTSIIKRYVHQFFSVHYRATISFPTKRSKRKFPNVIQQIRLFNSSQLKELLKFDQFTCTRRCVSVRQLAENQFCYVWHFSISLA